MTLLSTPVEMAQLMAGAQAILFICVGITLCEQVSLAAFDWSLIVGKRRRRLAQIPYFLAKVCWWTYIAVNLVTVYGAGPLPCQALISTIEGLMGAITVTCSILLACRTVCVFQGDQRRYVSYLLIVGTLALTAVWFAGVMDVTAVWTDVPANAWANGSCNFTSVKERYFVKYVVTIVYDFTVLVLTTAGVVKMSRSGSSRIGALIVDQGILYFVATFIANMLVSSFVWARGSPVMSLFWAVPVSCVMLVCSTRLYYNLAEAASHQPQGISNEQLQSGGSASDKVIHFFNRAMRSDPFSRSQNKSQSQSLSQSLSGPGGNETLRAYNAASSDADIEKHPSVDGISSLHKQGANHPFASMGSSKGQSFIGHSARKPSQSASGVEVAQTLTVTEEPIPTYLVHPGFLTNEQLARVQPDSEEARRMQDPVRSAYPSLRASRDIPRNVPSSEGSGHSHE